MPGGLLQIVATGAQDAHLSANPQITFWKMLYKRHTNFAMEAFRINFNGQPNWGTKQTAIVGRHADLLFKTYVEVQLPFKNNTGATGAWWNNDQGRLGYNLIDYVELDIGGQIIDRQYSEFMYLWDALTFDPNTSTKAWNMVGAGKNDGKTQLTDPVGCSSIAGGNRPSKPNTLYIPLYFFFTRNAGAALPLIALQYHEVKINVQWNDTKLIAGNFTDLSANPLPNPASAAIYIDYIYLDVDERRRFAQQTHEYLIEQSQFNEDQEISSAAVRLDLTFNHPVKELIWVVQPHSYKNCNDTKREFPLSSDLRLQPFTYDQSPVYEQYLQFNGQDRMDRRYGDYFNKVQIYQHHTGVGGTVSSTALPQTQSGIYCYSFALKPEEHQPSGTCNFSRIDTATIVMSLDGGIEVNQDTNKTWDVRVYAINYNMLRIMSGMAGLSYSN
jgi:hypothetical protein